MDVKNMKKKIEIFLDYFKNIICNPEFWISNHLVDYKTDKILNHCIDNFDFEKDEYLYDGYVFCFVKENVTFWITNYPYCFGHIQDGEWQYLKTFDKYVFSMTKTYNRKFLKRFLPKRYTRLKFHRFLSKLIGDIDVR